MRKKTAKVTLAEIQVQDDYSEPTMKLLEEAIKHEPKKPLTYVETLKAEFSPVK